MGCIKHGIHVPSSLDCLPHEGLVRTDPQVGEH